MYLLPEDEVKDFTVSSKLENNIKLMRVVDLPNTPQQYERLVKYGGELILHSINWDTWKISGRKFDHNGVVCCYEGANIPDSAPMSCGAKAIEALPLVLVSHALQGRKKYKLSFFDVSGKFYQKIEVKSTVCDVGHEYFRVTILTRSKYVAIFFNFYNEVLNERSVHCLFVMFEIQLKADNYFECVEITRINLEEHVDGQFDIEDMVFNETEERVLFQVKKLSNSPSLILLLYDIKTKSIEQIITAFENPEECKVYFVDNINCKGGIIVAVSYNSNEIRVYIKNNQRDYRIFKSFSFEFDNALPPHTYLPYCISNRDNQILFFQVNQSNVIVYDLFDTSNKTVLPISADKKLLYLYFNETGEEVYIYDKEKIYIYLYRSMFKSLVSQCVSVVRKTYTKSQLTEMRLPRQLYKYF